jgi:hypothetical protein
MTVAAAGQLCLTRAAICHGLAVKYLLPSERLSLAPGYYGRGHLLSLVRDYLLYFLICQHHDAYQTWM